MGDEERSQKTKAISRRRFLGVAGALATAAGLIPGIRIKRRGKLSGIAEAAERPQTGPAYRPPVMQTVTLKVNGTSQKIEVDTRTTLANALREHLHLTGTHVTCDRGECGACSVIVNGRAVYSCSVLATQVDGKEIMTVEGLAHGEKLDPVQEAFIECDGFQCGYCTSGQMMTMKALLMQNPNPTEDDVRHAIAGNICRCGAYPGIIKAGLVAAAKSKGQG
ncbi:MAG: yagT [Firmicutes bacterium]|nr:yagT [Bacillota bacterium]